MSPEDPYRKADQVVVTFSTKHPPESFTLVGVGSKPAESVVCCLKRGGPLCVSSCDQRLGRLGVMFHRSFHTSSSLGRLKTYLGGAAVPSCRGHSLCVGKAPMMNFFLHW